MIVDGELHLDMSSGKMSVYYNGRWVSLESWLELEVFFEKMEWSPVC